MAAKKKAAKKAPAKKSRQEEEIILRLRFRRRERSARISPFLFFRDGEAIYAEAVSRASPTSCAESFCAIPSRISLGSAISSGQPRV